MMKAHIVVDQSVYSCLFSRKESFRGKNLHLVYVHAGYVYGITSAGTNNQVSMLHVLTQL